MSTRYFGGEFFSGEFFSVVAVVEQYSGGYFSYPADYRKRKKRDWEVAEAEVKKAIEVIRNDPEDDELEIAKDVSRKLKRIISELESRASDYQKQLAAEENRKRQREIRRQLINAQLQAEIAQQQIEELDVAWVTMMIAAQL